MKSAGSKHETLDQTRMVYMGTPAISASILEGLLQTCRSLVGVVTQPDKPRGRGRKVTPSPVKQLALDHGIPVLQPHSVGDPVFLDALKSIGPDLVVTAAYGKILKAASLSIPPLGCFNIHFSLLPSYRGPAPVTWALLNGETETGITLFRMEEGMDTGDIVAVRSLAIDPDESAGELTQRLTVLARELLPHALEDVVRGRAASVPQDPSNVTYAPLLKKADGRIDWQLSAGEVRNRIRALDPWPGAFTFWKGKRLRLWEACVESEDSSGTPGEVLSLSETGLKVQAGTGVLSIRSLQLEGRRRMEISSFIRGQTIKAGDRFDSAP